MRKCLRCGKEFECGTMLTCRECVDRINNVIKKDLQEKKEALEINSRFDILDL